MSGVDNRVLFARYLTLVLTVTSRAIEQALDPDLPDLIPPNLHHFTKTVRGYLDTIDKAALEASLEMILEE
jgi:hypothetical protein